MDDFEGEPLYVGDGCIKNVSYSVLTSFSNQVDILGSSKLIFLASNTELKNLFAVC
jgi:hypothetical protein